MTAGMTGGASGAADAEDNLAAAEKDAMNILDKYADDSLFSTLLRYGLYYGACFQLVCILASLFLPLMDQKTTNGAVTGSGSLSNSNHESNNPLVN